MISICSDVMTSCAVTEDTDEDPMLGYVRPLPIVKSI